MIYRVSGLVANRSSNPDFGFLHEEAETQRN